MLSSDAKIILNVIADRVAKLRATAYDASDEKIWLKNKNEFNALRSIQKEITKHFPEDEKQILKEGPNVN
jgi:hypothetical protein